MWSHTKAKQVIIFNPNLSKDIDQSLHESSEQPIMPRLHQGQDLMSTLIFLTAWILCPLVFFENSYIKVEVLYTYFCKYFWVYFTKFEVICSVEGTLSYARNKNEGRSLLWSAGLIFLKSEKITLHGGVIFSYVGLQSFWSICFIVQNPGVLKCLGSISGLSYMMPSASEKSGFEAWIFLWMRILQCVL